MTRTPKQSAEIVERAITEIRKSHSTTDEIIQEVCMKYSVSEHHIRKVAGLPLLKQKNI